MTTADLHDPHDTALVRTLSHAGLIPFVLLAPLLWLLAGAPQTFVSITLAAYAALIVSFLGGIHWGMAWVAGRQALEMGAAPGAHHAQRSHILAGIAVTLLAWPGVLMPPFAGLAWLGFVFILGYLIDRNLYRHAGVEAWLTLRFRLAAVASFSCFIGAAAL